MDATTQARPLRILVVEDNVDDALLLERYLRKNGFLPNILRVETPAEMLAGLQQAVPPDLVLADYNLPEFSGPAALQMLKASGLDIPFIMLSGAMSETTAVESMRAGAQDYVIKQNIARLGPAVERELREAADRRKKLAAESALQASEDRFHRLVEAMPLGLLISDVTGRIVYANSAADSLFELSSVDPDAGPIAPKVLNVDTLAANTIDHLCPPLADVETFLRAQSVSSKPFEAICNTTTGRAIEVLIGIAVLNPDAPLEARQLAAFIADLTLQKKAEEALRRTEKLAVAGRLAASIAHEINNPLEAITNLLYLVGTTTLAGDAREYLDLAQKELDRVAQITVQTLRFHRRSTASSLSDIGEITHTVIPLFESRLRHIDAEVLESYRTTAPILIHEGEIRQVIANLISNSVDALPPAAPGGQPPRLYLRTHPAHHPRTGVPGVVLTVADTGIGISPAAISRIFEPFFSTKGATGTGLGLWVSLEIVERHHGTLRVRSAPTHGTIFRLFLPLTSPAVE